MDGLQGDVFSEIENRLTLKIDPKFRSSGKNTKVCIILQIILCVGQGTSTAAHGITSISFFHAMKTVVRSLNVCYRFNFSESERLLMAIGVNEMSNIVYVAD